MSSVVVTHGHGPMTQVVQTVSPAPILYREHYPATTSRALGICMIVGGVLGIIFAIMGIVWNASSAENGYAIWCNAPVIVTGVLAIIAANKRTVMITAVMVMSFISLCAVGLMGLIAIIALGVDRDLYPLLWLDEDDDPLRSNRIAVDASIIAISVLSSGFLLWSSIIAGNCCQTVPSSTVTAVSTTNHATVASYPPHQGYMQAPQPQYGPPPGAFEPLPAPGYNPNQGPSPANPPAYTQGGYDNYRDNYHTK